MAWLSGSLKVSLIEAFNPILHGRQQNLPAAVPWRLGCPALRSEGAFVGLTGRELGAPQAGASGTFGDAK